MGSSSEWNCLFLSPWKGSITENQISPQPTVITELKNSTMEESKNPRLAGVHSAFSRAERFLPPSPLIPPLTPSLISSSYFQLPPFCPPQPLRTAHGNTRIWLPTFAQRSSFFPAIINTPTVCSKREPCLVFSKPLEHLNNLLLQERGPFPPQFLPTPSDFLQRAPVGPQEGMKWHLKRRPSRILIGIWSYSLGPRIQFWNQIKSHQICGLICEFNHAGERSKEAAWWESSKQLWWGDSS